LPPPIHVLVISIFTGAESDESNLLAFRFLVYGLALGGAAETGRGLVLHSLN
jgi:hypothetical protein